MTTVPNDPQSDVFALAMAAELRTNAGKGDFLSWEPTAETLMSEIDHHVAKLRTAIAGGNAALIGEYAADLGNYASKAYAMADQYAACRPIVSEPTRTEASERRLHPDRASYLPNRAGDHAYELDVLRWQLNEALAELERLCGPTCPHDGKRAIEHKYALQREHSYQCAKCPEVADAPEHDRGSSAYRHNYRPRIYETVVTIVLLGGHPPAPEIEEWLSRGAK